MAVRSDVVFPLGILLPLSLLAIAGEAYAADSPSDAKAADVLFQNARAAMNRGDLAAACPQFAESQRLDPAPGTLLNLGECEARAGKVASALGHFREARGQLPSGDFRVAFAEARMAGLAHRVPQLTIKLTAAEVDGVVVQCDGVDVPKAALDAAAPVDPGTHACVVRAPGHVDARSEVTLREGESKTLELAPGPIGPAKDAAPPRSTVRSDAPADDTAGSTQRTAGLLVAGSGLAAVVVGSVFGILSKGTYDEAQTHCPNGTNSCDPQGVQGGKTAYDQAMISDVALIGGAVLLAGGAVLYFTAPKGTRVAVSPTVGSTGAGVSLAGSWW
jgi:hypothetical protein